MTFHENRLLADDSHEISYLIFYRKVGKMSQNLSCAAVVIGALRVRKHLSSPQDGFVSVDALPHSQQFFSYARILLWIEPVLSIKD